MIITFEGVKIELVKQIQDRVYFAKEVVFKGNPEILQVEIFFLIEGSYVICRHPQAPTKRRTGPPCRNYFKPTFENTVGGVSCIEISGETKTTFFPQFSGSHCRHIGMDRFHFFEKRRKIEIYCYETQIH